MQTAKTYLHLVPSSSFINWSVQYMLDTKFSYADKYELEKIGGFLKRNKTAIDVEDDKEYKRVTIKINNGGVCLRDIQKGTDIGTKKQFVISEGQFLLSKIDARNGAFGVVPKSADGAIITGNFWAFDVDYSKINPHFLALITTTPEFIKFSENASNGTTNRLYLQEKLFISQQIPLPSLEEQSRIIDNYNAKIRQTEKLEQQVKDLEKGIEEYLFDILGIEKKEKRTTKSLIFVNSSLIKEWGIDRILGQNQYLSSKYESHSFESNLNLFQEILRGKSPKYSDKSNSIILNQKCNRWDNIEISHAKFVDDDWFKSLSTNHFTQIGDILINSTGEGTIGRASAVKDRFDNLMYDSHILLLRVNTDLICPNYFTIVFNSSYGQQQVNSIKSAQSTKQTELGVGNLQKIKFPLPQLETQKEIAHHIQNMRKKIHDFRQSAEESRKRAVKEFEQEIFE